MGDFIQKGENGSDESKLNYSDLVPYEHCVSDTSYAFILQSQPHLLSSSAYVVSHKIQQDYQVINHDLNFGQIFEQ